MMPQQVQLSAQQLAHAIEVYEGRVAAKQREMGAYAILRDTLQAALADLLALTRQTGEEPPDYQGSLRLALTELFMAKHAEAAFELEEFQLQLRAMKQAQSGVVGVIVSPNRSPR